jgi:hypothetical protein
MATSDEIIVTNKYVESVLSLIDLQNPNEYEFILSNLFSNLEQRDLVSEILFFFVPFKYH